MLYIKTVRTYTPSESPTRFKVPKVIKEAPIELTFTSYGKTGAINICNFIICTFIYFKFLIFIKKYHDCCLNSYYTFKRYISFICNH